MATNITSTALDFESIKDRLKTYLANSGEFSDYDFEASGLSNILDVLAYNTHFNGLTANFALNEAFLQTAQLRSSVVGHAEVLGLNVRSKTASSVALEIDVDLTSASPKPSSIELPRGSTYSTSLDGTTYTFRTLEAYTAVDDGTGVYTFKNDDGDAEVLAYEGEEITKTFYVGDHEDYQIYVIPDAQMDTSTAKVLVYDSTTSTSFTEYTKITQAITVDQNSTYYSLREAPNGLFELNFGDGVTFGKAPTTGQKIVVTYLRPTGADANGSGNFTANEDIDVNGTNYPQAVTASSDSTGGAEKQTIESIRQTAPIAFASQQRLVTSLDYEGLIKSNYAAVADVKAWGGEENIPIDYGRMYISLKYNDGVSAATKTATQNKIQSELTDQLSVTSITPQFVDPESVYLELTCIFEYDPDLTGLTAGNMETRVRNKIISYFNDNLGEFDDVFRRSQLLADIDDIDNAILSSRIDPVCQMRLTPTFGATANAYELNFPMPIAMPDDEFYRVQSEPFTNQDGIVCVIRNKLGTSQLELVNANTKAVITNNVGSYRNTTGEVSIDSLTALSVVSGNTYIKFTAVPANPAVIRPLRNYLLELDQTKLVASAVRDNQNTEVTL